MSNMNGSDPNRLLNECRSIDRAIDDLEQNLERLKVMHRRAADDTQVGVDNNLQQQVNAQGDEIMGQYRALGQRVKRIKSDPESGNPRNAPQVGKVDRRIKTMINKYQQADSEYRKRLQERSAREYRIVRPDASDAEVREATEDPNQQIFSQAVCSAYIDSRYKANN
jgi:syntaxin 1B/2/3